MAYNTLYRRWRPQKFDDIVGQAHITETLKNEINSGFISHAFLFTGTRGTGKTSSAKILSRALNCPNVKDANPCNECEVCKAILNETCLDVSEIDAASNTGVDNIRDIISNLQYLPSMCKYKVFIIDEVHMLSKGAFNALLKTLEEPPSHVVFILATTEIQQIPATILSRCQRFDFKTISIKDISDNIKYILDNENIEYSDDAIDYVAYLGDGSMRDSLSILDQCISYANGNLTYENVIEVVGSVDDKILFDFANDIINSDTKSALSRFNECINSGKNIDSIMKGILEAFREIIMYKVNGESFYSTSKKMEMILSCAKLCTIESLSYYIDTISDIITSSKSSSSQRSVCECGLIKLTTPKFNSGYDSLLARLSVLENKINLIGTSDYVPTKKISEKPTSPKEEVRKDVTYDVNMQDDISNDINNNEINNQVNTSSDTDDAKKVVSSWSEVMSYISSNGKLKLYTLLLGLKVSSKDNKLCILSEEKERLDSLKEKEILSELKESIIASLGIDVDISFQSTHFDNVNDLDDDIFASLNSVKEKFPTNFDLN